VGCWSWGREHSTASDGDLLDSGWTPDLTPYQATWTGRHCEEPDEELSDEATPSHHDQSRATQSAAAQLVVVAERVDVGEGGVLRIEGMNQQTPEG
jgi:hypothetical protein